MTRIGLISDTHGLMRPEASSALAGVAHIVHAGDIGSARCAGTTQHDRTGHGVRGNNDKAAWAKKIPENEVLEVEGRSIYVLHDLKELDLDPAEAGFAAVIAGHSHKPVDHREEWRALRQPRQRGPPSIQVPDRGRRTRDRRGASFERAIHELVLSKPARDALRLHGLGDVELESRGERTLPIFNAAERRERDRRNSREFGHSANFAE